MQTTAVKQKDHLFQDKAFLQKLLRLALPIAFQSLMTSVVAAADALMLGMCEQNMMSAVSLATQIQFVQNCLISASTSSFIVLGAQYWGKGDLTTLKRVFNMAARFCVLVSLLFFTGCFFFPRTLMLLMTNQEPLIEIGIDYLRIASWSYILTGVSQCYSALLKTTDKTKMVAWTSFGTVMLNIVLNSILIFGLFGCPAFGAKGAAIATLISRCVELVWLVALSFRKGYVRPNWGELFYHEKQLSASFRKCLLPILGASLAWSVGFTSYTAFIGHFDVDAAAGNSVASVVRDLICCFCNGLASGGGIIIGNELGAGHLEKAKLYGDRMVKFSFLCGFASTIIMLALTPLILSFVKLSEGATELLIGMMIIMSFYMIGRAVNTVLINGVIDSGGDTMFDLYSLAVTMWGIAVPLAAAGTFLFHWPALVVYACTCLDEVGKIPWVLIHYKKYKWVKDLTIERKDAEVLPQSENA